ncbi:MAG: hypothetical protein O3C40_01910 [Planctomycetota bacterium]|nr:hypothetical protein [Planctomycetota bacterium]
MALFQSLRFTYLDVLPPQTHASVIRSAAECEARLVSQLDPVEPEAGDADQFAKERRIGGSQPQLVFEPFACQSGMVSDPPSAMRPAADGCSRPERDWRLDQPHKKYPQ